ncbi:MAG: hypothetical protein M0R77_00160 [Gammaproteobacteria bacterium]|nr:hypothetical protein [Acholeplasmataceae bacterium]MCK9528967.1 hypothetical protein [Gammaproteobacteria bacterium]
MSNSQSTIIKASTEISEEVRINKELEEIASSLKTTAKINIFDKETVFHVFNKQMKHQTSLNRWNKFRNNLKKYDHTENDVVILEIHKDLNGYKGYFIKPSFITKLESFNSYLSSLNNNPQLVALLVTRYTKTLKAVNKKNYSDRVFFTVGLMYNFYDTFHNYTDRFSETLIKSLQEEFSSPTNKKNIDTKLNSYTVEDHRRHIELLNNPLNKLAQDVNALNEILHFSQKLSSVIPHLLKVAQTNEGVNA